MNVQELFKLDGRVALAKLSEAVIARAPLHRIGGDEDLKGAVVFSHPKRRGISPGKRSR